MKWFQFQIYSLVQNTSDTWSRSFWIWKNAKPFTDTIPTSCDNVKKSRKRKFKKSDFAVTSDIEESTYDDIMREEQEADECPDLEEIPRVVIDDDEDDSDELYADPIYEP